jgi:hypothetical protein
LSSGTHGIGRPTTSLAVHPNSFSAAGFQNRTIAGSGSVTTIGTGDASMSTRSSSNDSCAFAARSRAPETSTRTLTAPATRPVSSKSGFAKASAFRRRPSGCSIEISLPLKSRPSRSASAIQHSECGIGRPSTSKSLNEPQKRSSGSRSFGSRPQSEAARELKYVMRPSASQR